MGEERGLGEYKGGSGWIQGEAECRSETTKEVRYSRREKL